jgi:3-phenylpropionate/cinnamic acid dioxygenase small subunit
MISARSEIENALYRWAWCYDEYDLDGFLDSVTADARVLIETSDGRLTGPLQGRAAIGEFYGARLAARSTIRRHLTTNVIVEDETADSARTRSLLTLVAERDGAPAVIATGTYRDELRREEDAWRICDRHIFLEVAAIPAP